MRQQLADIYVRTQLRTATTDRVARAAAAGAPPGPAASIGKIAASQNLTRIGDVAASLLGARIAADTGEPDAFAWTEHVLGAPGYRLAGGTDEIQRNIIGERVLGLPREPRVDKGVPVLEAAPRHLRRAPTSGYQPSSAANRSRCTDAHRRIAPRRLATDGKTGARRVPT